MATAHDKVMNYKKQVLSLLVFLCPMLFSTVSILEAASPTELSALSNTASNENDSIAPPAGSLDDMAQALLTYFPKVTGEVIAVDRETVRIKMAQGYGLTAGLLLSVYRAAEPFYHPVTGIPLGHFEDDVAQVELASIEQEQIVARVIGQTIPIQLGDGVRLTATRIPIAITAGTATSDPFLMREWIDALSETERFAITLLPPLSTITDAAKVGSLYVITFIAEQTVSDPTAPFNVAARVQNVKTAKVLSDIRIVLQESEEYDFIVEALQYRLFKKRQQETLGGTQTP